MEVGTVESMDGDTGSLISDPDTALNHPRLAGLRRASLHTEEEEGGGSWPAPYPAGRAGSGAGLPVHACARAKRDGRADPKQYSRTA